MDSISVTIPLYNEAQNIEPLYRKLSAVLGQMGNPYELIFIDDGSRDDSLTILEKLAQTDEKVKIINFTRNFGQTAAMMAGFDYASGDIIVPIDADQQNDPEDIPRLIAKLEEGYDVCSGWRKNRKDAFIKRVLISRAANKLISFISHVKLKDFGCTLKAYRKNVIKGVNLYGEMHRFIPIYASWEGARITEIPVNHHPRTYGSSSYGLDRTIKVLLDLIVVSFLDNYAQKPIYIFGGIGFMTFIASFACLVYATYLKFFQNISYIQTPMILLSAVLLITGFLCILMGLLAEMIMRTYYESQQKRVYIVSTLHNLKGRG